jgi:flagellar motor switch protein FliG
MSNRKSIVVAAYGHNRTIDKIAVSLFEDSESGYYKKASDAKNYCDTINALELKGDSWVFAKILSENTQYSLDGKDIQKILREVDQSELAKALKDQDEMVKEKIFANMSQRAALMVKEDIEFMGPVRISDVKYSQENILNIIRRLEQW